MILNLSFWRWLTRLGGPGLLLLGIADSSLIPLPGSQDLATIVLSALHRELWWYYALMSSIGSIIGGYMTYGIGQKGGAETLESRLSEAKVRKVDQAFEKWGFGTLLVSAILPPPFPMAPMLAGAGALNYPAKKFLAALALGRSFRFAAVAYLGSIYGAAGYRFFSNHTEAFGIAFVVVGVLGGAAAVVYFMRRKKAARSF
jgi:membrane protein YqaA with SNARE-associated domain